jgi:hypothetical protein
MILLSVVVGFFRLPVAAPIRGKFHLPLASCLLPLAFFLCPLLSEHNHKTSKNRTPQAQQNDAYNSQVFFNTGENWFDFHPSGEGKIV